MAVRPLRPGPGRAPSLIDSFNYAFEGIIHVLRTQRNMRIHFMVAAGVLIAAVAIGVTRMELIALMLAIAFVMFAEMVNTAIEGAVDVSTTSFDPNAKLAKDIAAGAVLIATVTAVAVGYLIFSERLADRSSRLLERLSEAPAELTLVALVLTTIAVIGAKAITRSGTPLRGGFPSGHAALAFAGWMAITLLVDEQQFLVSSVAFVLAVLVAQTRVESGIHSPLEVFWGALLGSLTALVVIQVFAS
jgi:diacylglycerol kinase (ATP)